LAKVAPTDAPDEESDGGGSGTGLVIGAGVVAAAAIGGAIAFRKRRMQGPGESANG
jgi:hypothetical protein